MRLILILTAFAGSLATADANVLREVLISSPAIDQVLVQATSSRGELRFEICDLDLTKFTAPDEMSIALNQGQVTCRPVSDVTLDAGDERVRTFILEKFTTSFESVTHEAPRKLRNVGVLLGTLMTAATALNTWTSWVHAFTGPAGRLALTRGQVLGRSAALTAESLAFTAVPIFIVYATFSLANAVDHSRQSIELLKSNGRLIDSPAPVVHKDIFRLIARILAETLSTTAEAQKIR